jgi:hypothetical protein
MPALRTPSSTSCDASLSTSPYSPGGAWRRKCWTMASFSESESASSSSLASLPSTTVSSASSSAMFQCVRSGGRGAASEASRVGAVR